MREIDARLQARFGQVELLAMDVDGVLTDGGVYILDDGMELRRFDIKDGLGLKRVQAAGVPVIWISAGKSAAARYRAERLGIAETYYGVEDKLETLREVCARNNISLDKVVFIGDDLTDQEVLGEVGLSCVPADGVGVVKEIAAYVTEAAGGRGAVREVCELILASIQARERNRAGSDG